MPPNELDGSKNKDYLRDLTEQLLARDRDAHRDAVHRLAEKGDDRVIPHLIELVVIDSVANNWTKFGFPEVLRERNPPRYLELPDVEWPGVVDALCELAEPDYNDEIAWLKWESWYSQQDLEPLEGFDRWKLRLYKSFLPPVGALLDVNPREIDIQDVRWGNCDRSFLSALNAPSFVEGKLVDSQNTERDNEQERYLKDDDLVFGFEVNDDAFAVPRKILFPHELMNAEVNDKQLTLTYCTLCNAPILYDRHVGDRVLTFGNTGMLWQGNKMMYDEETESLWSQHRGTPLAGEYLERGVELNMLAVTQTEWKDWKHENPDTYALDIPTGYGFDYQFYDDYTGFIEQYWKNEEITQPGVKAEREKLPEKEYVYGVTTSSGELHVYPVESVRDHQPIIDEIDGRAVVVVINTLDDVAVYEAPSLPVEKDGDLLVESDGTEWLITPDSLVSNTEEKKRISGRHGLWFAFRTQYDKKKVVKE